MIELVPTYDVRLPDKRLDIITQENFIKYENWTRNKNYINSNVVNQFDKAAKGSVVWSDENVPDKVEEDPLVLGAVEFKITSTPTTKRAGYKPVLETFEKYLNFILYQYEKEKKVKNVRTINNEPYMLLDELKEKLEGDVREIRKEKEGVSKGLELVKPLDLLKDIPETLSISYDRDYSILEEYNARAYIIASKFIEIGEERAKPFMDILYEETMKHFEEHDLLDEKGIPKNKRNVPFPLEIVTLFPIVGPKTTPKYAQIINAFIKEPTEAQREKPGRITKKTVIGDFVKIEMMSENEQIENIFRGKDLVDDKFFADYNPTQQDVGIFIRIKGIIDRLEYYKSNEPWITTSTDTSLIIQFSDWPLKTK